MGIFSNENYLYGPGETELKRITKNFRKILKELKENTTRHLNELNKKNSKDLSDGQENIIVLQNEMTKTIQYLKTN